MPELDMNIILVSLLNGVAMIVIAYAARPYLANHFDKESQRFDNVLNKELMLNIKPINVFIGMAAAMVFFGIVVYAISQMLAAAILVAGAIYFVPTLVMNQLAQKRRKKLDEQLIDCLTTMSSGVRAGLNLVQSIKLLVQNSYGPAKQEFSELVKEYELGVELHQAMQNTANRIGSSHYRLVFTALQAHRERGGNMAESLDRISESVREFQRLEGKLTSLTAAGRSQARMMAAMAFFIIVILFAVMPEEMENLVFDPVGRLILLGCSVVIILGFLWIRKIMEIDI